MNEKVTGIVKSLGQRVKQRRIGVNLTQNQLADMIGKSRTAIERAEKGRCNLTTFISILVALDADNQLHLFMPESPESPVLLAKTKGKQPQRASGKIVDKINKDDLQW